MLASYSIVDTQTCSSIAYPREGVVEKFILNFCLGLLSLNNLLRISLSWKSDGMFGGLGSPAWYKRVMVKALPELYGFFWINRA